MPSSSPASWKTGERLIGALLIGNNVATIVSSALATELLLSWFGDVGVIYASVAMTVLVIVFCELLPKTAAIIAPDRHALAVARPIARVVAVLGPVLTASEWLVRKMLGARPASGPARASRCCRRMSACAARSTCCTARAASKSSIATCSADLLDLRDLTVADVMIHRTEVITADVGEPPDEGGRARCSPNW